MSKKLSSMIHPLGIFQVWNKLLKYMEILFPFLSSLHMDFHCDCVDCHFHQWSLFLHILPGFFFLWLCNDSHFDWGIIPFLIINNIEQYFISFILEFFARICSPILIISFPDAFFVFFCIQNSNLFLTYSQDSFPYCKLSLCLIISFII